MFGDLDSEEDRHERRVWAERGHYLPATPFVYSSASSMNEE
jgi:hypothetical protein